MPKYPENLIHFCRPVLEHYELSSEMGRMFVRSMSLPSGEGKVFSPPRRLPKHAEAAHANRLIRRVSKGQDPALESSRRALQLGAGSSGE